LIIKPLGNRRNKPDDLLGHKLARILIEPSETRSRLTRLAYSEAGENCPVGRMEEAFHKICAADALERKVMRAVKDNILKSLTLLEQIDEALHCGLLNDAEAKQLKEAELARQEVIKVDDFNDEDLRRSSPMKAIKNKKTIMNKDDVESEII
jgi:acyl-CoA dehydrogenase